MIRQFLARLVRPLRARARNSAAAACSEEHYRRLFDASPLPMWVYDVTTLRFLEVNDAAVHHYGYTREEFLAMTIADIRPPQDVPRLLEALAQPVLDGFDKAGLWQHRKRDGTVIDVEITAHAVDFAGCAAEMVLAHDVSVRVGAERTLERSRRLFEMLLQTNQLLVRAPDRDALFDGVCRVAVEHGGFRFAWIGILEPDGTVRPVARAGDDIGYIDALNLKLNPAEEKSGSPGLQALQTGHQAFNQDFLADPDTARWHDGARRARFGAAAALPIACEGRTIGTLNLYAPDSGFFGPGEQQTLHNMAADVSFALDVLKRSEALAAASGVIEASPVVLFRWGPQDGWPVEFVSSNIARWGYRAEDFMATRRRFDSIMHATDRARVADEVERHLEAGSSEFVLVYRIVTSAGETRWVEESTNVERDAGGAVRLFQGTVSDITERHVARLAQQESEQTLREILETVHVGVWVTDAAGRIVTVNRAGRAIWAGERLVGPEQYGLYKAWWADTGKPVEPGEWSAERAVRRGETSIDEVIDIECFDGTRKTVLNSAVPLLDAGGAIRGVIVVNHDITERHQAEQRLQAAKAQYRQLFDVNPSPVIAYDVESLRIVAVNKTAVRHYGWSHDEFLAMTIADLRPPEDVPRLREWLANRSPTDDAAGLWRHRKRDGTVFDVEVVSQPMEFAGRPTRIVAVADVTARLQAERRARESARLIKIAGEIASIGGWEVDMQTRLLRGSAEVCRIHDLPVGTVVPVEQALEYFVPESRPRIRDAFRACAFDGRPYDEELEIVTATGRRAWVRTVGRAVRDARGRIVRIEGAYQDITTRRRAQDTLRKLSLAVEQTSECIAITDLAGKIEYVNDAFTTVSGYTREELIGRNPRVLQSGRTPRSTYETMWETLLAGRTWTGEFINIRKNGLIYIEEATVSPLRQDDGRITHYIAVKEDVTERRRSEAELERYRARLEELVDQRTAQLEEARRGAEAANEAKSAFLANMSHEIRTPMNGVLGMLEVLERSRLTEEQSECVRTARDSGHTLLGIIDGILDLSKIEAGHVQINLEPVMLSDLAEGLCESLQPLAQRGEVDLTVFVDPGLPERVLTDPLRLRQILFNLVGNGIKFSAGRDGRRGRVWLRVTPAPTMDDGGPAIAFAVGDNGIGMNARTVSQLFQPFTQGEASTTRRFGGTGLGLTICRRLSELMAGRIDVESAPEAGSTFTVTLPAEPAPLEAPRKRIDLAGVRCVLVGSPALDSAGLAAYLQAAGAEVHAADTAADAAAALAAGGTSIAILHGATKIAVPEPAAADVRYVVITQGRRRRPRVSLPTTVTIDIASLRRDALLRAVAVAAGLASPEVPMPEPDPVALPLRAPTVDEARARGALILVAEDDEVSRKVITRQLELLGYAVEVAPDGAEALRRWRAGGHALLLSDLHMPELDGYGLAAAIRREEASSGTPRRPILALTANALSGEAARARARGMDDYLTKPLRLDQLRDALARWLPRPACGDAPGAAGTAIDMGVLRALIGDDDFGVNELLSVFLDNCESARRALGEGVEAGNFARVAALAHRMKTSSQAIGSLRLAELAAGVEAAASAGDRAALDAQLPRVVEELQRVQCEIETHLAGSER